MRSSWCARQEKLGRGSRWFACDDGSNSGNGSLLFRFTSKKKYIYIINRMGVLREMRGGHRARCITQANTYAKKSRRAQQNALMEECVPHTHTLLCLFSV